MLSILLLAAGVWTALRMPSTLSRSHRAHRHDPGRRPRDGGRKRWNPSYLPIESAITAPRASAASAPRRGGGIGVIWVEFRLGDRHLHRPPACSRRILPSWLHAAPRSSAPFCGPSRPSWARSSSRLSSESVAPLTMRTWRTGGPAPAARGAGVSQVTPIGGAERHSRSSLTRRRCAPNNVSLTSWLDGVRGRARTRPPAPYGGPQEFVLQAVWRVRTSE